MPLQRASCKACNTCRARKVKCDGSRPRCEACVNRLSHCVYPLDGRYRRAGSATLSCQEQTPLPRSPHRNTGRPKSSAAHIEPQPQDVSHWEDSLYNRLPPLSATDDGPSRYPVLQSNGAGTYQCPPGLLQPFYDALVSRTASASPRTKRTPSAIDVEVSRSRLIANSALLRQREFLVLHSRPFSCTADLDGLDPVSATHLIELYWNTVHLTWQLTYRPAVMDSLLNGGSYMNKLLLNAIYLSASLHSDRSEVRGKPAEGSMPGWRFYARFCQLLADELDNPSVPTAIALLLCGSSLVCAGKPGTGRTLCDIGIKMVRDLGCHHAAGGASCGQVADTTPFLTDVDAEVRKHLYLGSYCIDIFMSLYLGHKPTIDEPDFDQISADIVLDTYEELENWSPYTDSTTAGREIPDIYESHPTYAVSSFRALFDLLKVCHSIIVTFYSDPKKWATIILIQQAVTCLDSQLDRWYETLPSFIRDSAVSSTVPPPHLIDLLLLFHALRILVRRPLLEQTHLAQQLGISHKASIEGECRHEAGIITDLIGTYMSAFGLRRASLITSFVTYLGLATLVRECRPNAIPAPTQVELLRAAFSRMADGPNPSLHRVIAQTASQENSLRQFSAVQSDQTTSTSAIATSDTSTDQRDQAALPEGERAAGIDRHSTALSIDGISPQAQSPPVSTSDRASYQESTATAVQDSSIYVSRLLDLFPSVGATGGSQRWVHGAAELSRNHPLLETALGAVSMLLIGKLNGDADTEQSGELAYITVLRGVNEVINNEGEDSVSLELLYTLLFRRKSESSASYHWIAALTVFERRGPFRHTSGLEHLLYSELRLLCVTWALTVRASTFLSKTEWKVIPWLGGGQTNVLHHLLDVLVDIPSFLEQVDTMNSLEGHQAVQKETQQQLLTVWSSSLQDALHQWKRTYADTYHNGEPYEVPQASGFPLFQHWSDEIGALSTPTAWMFPDPLLATSICMYNAAHLILMEAGSLLGSSDEPERYRYAWEICRSVQYYVRHAPWSFLLQTEFPLRVAYQSLPETSVERTFIREACSLIRENSKLEVFSSVTEGQHFRSVVPCSALQRPFEE
ncbi:hypothetical protein BDV24DRAFT_164159 [Aspergillus arachidicola]|uniref:Zn(2)-C6 fungal-type domain-containing protein n=1 Tax=Aspergillus arachidicola TaxID=656916 RepID=A0A5N6Y786_9EURO|nr:hypothetical protein BDV24DRAFT_164159 [Aspergillus arachidicola]